VVASKGSPQRITWARYDTALNTQVLLTWKHVRLPRRRRTPSDRARADVPVVAVGQLRAVIDSRTSNSFVGRGLPFGQATALALGQQLRALAPTGCGYSS
jgi:hypothetical protein